MQRYRWWLSAVLAPWLLVSEAQAQIQPQLQASRLSCTAPCAIQFDASTSSHSSPDIDAFTDLEYLWDFGDTAAGNWSIGALRGPRNEAIGPLASHVFERPGSYTVRLRVFDATGAQASTQRQISVADPDTTFAGTATTCLALDALDWSGCPQGARREVGGDAVSAYASFGGAGQRLLLRKGDAFAAAGSLRLVGQGPGQIGAFGSGALPRVQQQSGGVTCIDFGSTQQATTDFSVFELRCEKPVAQQNDFSSFLGHSVSADLQAVQHILVGRVEAGGYAALHGGPLLGDPPRDRIQHVTLYEAREDGFTRGSFVINFPFGRGLSWLGVRIDRSTEVCISTNSVLRSATLQRAVISQVEFVDSCTGPLRLQSIVTSDPDGQRPEKIVVTRSIIGGINASSGAFGGNGGPTSTGLGSGAAQFRDYVFEGNFVRYGANNNAAFDWSGRNFIARNNVFDLRGTASNGDAFGVFTKNGGDHGATTRIRFVHNTIFQLQAGAFVAAFSNSENATDVRAYNNALRTVSGTLVGAVVGDGFTAQAGNVIAGPTVANPLIAATPSYGVLSDYCPRSGGVFAASGSPQRAALDAFGRPRGAAPSAGFCEHDLSLFANGFEL